VGVMSYTGSKVTRQL